MTDKPLADYGVLCVHCNYRYWYKVKGWPPELKFQVLKEAGWKYDFSDTGGLVCPECVTASQPGKGDK